MHAPKLSGWKEIADYLKVSVRTAQNFEDEDCLPVHRGLGPKGRVWASTEELEAWRREFQSRHHHNHTAEPSNLLSSDQANTEGGRGSMVIASPPATEAGDDSTRRQWFHKAALAGGVLTIGGVGAGLAKLYLSKPRKPVAYRIEDSRLVVSDVEKRVIWQHEFSGRISPHPLGPNTERCTFEDVDGDGRIETLFACFVEDAQESTLVCFDDSGQIRWTFSPGRTVRDNMSREFTPPYNINCFAVIHPPKSRTTQVVAASTHHLSFPSQIVLLDGPTGKLMGEYWHRGHVPHIAIGDIDGDGHPEVLIAGVNDAPEHRRATIVVFDHRRISGSDRDPEGKPYFQGLPPGSEKRVVYFPRTEASADQEFNLVKDVHIIGSRITAFVVESPDESKGASMTYELDFDLHARDLVFSPDLRAYYLQGQKSHRLPVESLDRIAARLQKQVEVIKYDAR